MIGGQHEAHETQSQGRAVRVKKVVVPPTAVLHVEVPRDHVPLVAVNPDNGIVEVVPVPKKKKLTLWQTLFGE